MKMLAATLRILVLITLWAQAGEAADRSKLTCEQLLADVGLSKVVHANIAQVQNYPGQWAMASTQIMVDLISHFKYPNMDFAYFEKLFRRDDVPLYLVAHSGKPPLGLYVGYPSGMSALKTENPKYWLWVCVNGKEEADELKASLGLSDKQNLENLRNTGVLVKVNPANN